MKSNLESTISVTFQDPPPKSAGRPAWPGWVLVEAELRSRPGQWALLASGARQGLPSSVKKALGAGFEVTSRSVDKKFNVYARFVG